MQPGSITQNAIVENYRNEYDRFRKLCVEVETRVRARLAQTNIQSTISARAKSVSSLERKLEKPKFADRITPGSDYRAALPDLAAVRVSTYRQSDRGRVVDILQELFRVQEGSLEILDGSRRGRTDISRWYSATHLQVGLHDTETRSPDMANLRDIWCEVQVCSLVSHVWNEVEHDVNYKSFLPCSAAGQELLDELGAWREAGDKLIDSILDEDARNRIDLGAAPIMEFAEFRRALLLPKPYSFVVEPTEFWGEIHKALLAAGVRAASGVWSAVDLHLANYPDQLMARMNTHPIELLRAVGARAAVRLPTLTTVLNPENHSHRFIVSVMPALSAPLSESLVPRVRSVARSFTELVGSRQ
jgi:ppGpp synthetase/RelA/SpoT-type nucleotidyltranferase